MGDSKFRDPILAAASRILPKARRQISQITNSTLDHDDVAQELFLRLVRRGSAFDPGRGSPETFVNITLDHLLAELRAWRTTENRGGRHVTLPLSSDFDDRESTPEIADTVSTPDAVAMLSELMDGFDSQDRALIETLLHGRSVSDIARELGVNRSTVYERLGAIRRIVARKWPTDPPPIR